MSRENKETIEDLNAALAKHKAFRESLKRQALWFPSPSPKEMEAARLEDPLKFQMVKYCSVYDVNINELERGLANIKSISKTKKEMVQLEHIPAVLESLHKEMSPFSRFKLLLDDEAAKKAAIQKMARGIKGLENVDLFVEPHVHPYDYLDPVVRQEHLRNEELSKLARDYDENVEQLIEYAKRNSIVKEGSGFKKAVEDQVKFISEVYNNLKKALEAQIPEVSRRRSMLPGYEDNKSTKDKKVKGEAAPRPEERRPRR